MKAKAWAGVDRIVGKAGVKTVPEAAVAVFVGTKFDPLAGRGGGAIVRNCKLDETRSGLKELGLSDGVTSE